MAQLDIGADDQSLGRAVRDVILSEPEHVEDPSLADADVRLAAFVQRLGLSRSAFIRAVGVTVSSDGEQAQVAVMEHGTADEEGVYDTGEYLWADLADPARLGQVVRAAIDRST